MLTQRRSSCLSFAFVGKFFPCLIFPLHEIFMVDYQVLIFFFGNLELNSINAMHPKTRKILQLLRLRQVLHETMFLCLELYVSIKYTLFLIGLLLNDLKLEALCCE